MANCIHCGATDEPEHGVVVFLHGELNEAVCTVCRTDELRKETVLSPRQAEIQAFTEAGWSRQEIADYLNISIHTVDEHRQAIKEKIRRSEATVADLGGS